MQSQLPLTRPVFGLVLNGSFEETPEFVHWTYGQLPPEHSIGLTNLAFQGNQAVLLGTPSPQEPHSQGKAWICQTMYIRPEWRRLVLTFHYRMFVNDTIDYSVFYVWFSNSNGLLLKEILRDGYCPCMDPPMAPPPGYDMGWQTVTYDLSPYKGQTIRIVFEDRNLHGGYSYGIWTYLDNVDVVDAGLLNTPVGFFMLYLPIITNQRCDPVPPSIINQSGFSLIIRNPLP